MVKPEVIRRRLERLDYYLSILKRFNRYDLETFLSDPEHYGSAERFLQLAIETTLDVGSHIVAEENLGTIEHSRDIARCLKEHGHISQDLEHRWMRMIGFRNILVHDYLEVDQSIVYDVVINKLVDIEELSRAFAGFL